MVIRKTAVRLCFVSLFVMLIPVAAQQPGSLDQGPNLDTIHPTYRGYYFVMRRGANWLVNAQLPNGMFHQGLNVAINAPLDAAHFYHQAEATLTLAKVG